MTTSSLDYYGIEELLTDKERAIRDRTRRFVQEEVMQEVVPCHRAGKFPEHLIARMGALGFYAPQLKEHGCAGLSYTAYGLIMQELERGDSGLRSFVSVQGALCMYPIHAYGSDDQKNKWLPKMATGEVIGCFGLTEADFGSNPSGMLTNAHGLKSVNSNPSRYGYPAMSCSRAKLGRRQMTDPAAAATLAAG